MRFGETDVPVILTGDEWVAMVGKITGQQLSAKGTGAYITGTMKLCEQLLAASRKQGDTSISDLMIDRKYPPGEVVVLFPPRE